jgi:hypothetical protein
MNTHQKIKDKGARMTITTNKAMDQRRVV